MLTKSVIEDYSSRNGLTSLRDDQVFELFAVHLVTKEFELSHSEVEESIVDGSSDGGIDSFITLIGDQPVSTLEELDDLTFTTSTAVNVIVIQAKTSTSFQESVIDKLYSSSSIIFDLRYNDQQLLDRFNSKLAEKIIVMRKAWEKTVSSGGNVAISFFYICLANEITVNSAFDSKKEQLISDTQERTVGIPVNLHPLSSRELLEKHQKPQDTTLTLRFMENPTPVGFHPGKYGYIGVVSLRDYYNFIVDDTGSVREPIFESNVRHYQGDVDVNNNIKKTIEGDYSVDFWWLNNGITIIASSCKPYPKVLHLDNVKVVNGLQTSYTIGKSYAKDSEDNRSVLVKVVIIEDQDKEILDKIISSSNRQNPITPTILRATDDVQRKIELFFLSKGYFYDRRKNYYKNQDKPANKIFSIQYAAQAIEAVKNKNPSEARSKPTTLIKSDSSYRSIFDEKTSFSVYLNCCLLHQKVLEFIRTELADDAKNLGKNFAYHITMITAAVLTSKADYTDDELADLDVSKVSETSLEQAFSILRDILQAYQDQNPQENIINIAKAKRFAVKLNDDLPRTLDKTIATEDA